jgi:hypothetical protein
VLDGANQQTIDELFELGDLSWMLDDHQDKRIYEHYRAWEDAFRRGERGEGANRVWMLEAGRQVGKTFTVDLIKIEDCQRWPGTVHLLASAEKTALVEYVIPNIEAVLSHVSEHLQPEFVGSKQGARSAYYFRNGSVLKLAGVDNDPHRLRGPRLHGAAISEAGFVDKLRIAIGGVIYPQFQRGGNATLILESSTPAAIDHDFSQVFRPSCQRRKAYVMLTIDDNTALSDSAKREFVEAAREIDPEDADREYYCVEVRNTATTVFPEFDRRRMLLQTPKPRPKHALCMTTIDPGQRHLFGIMWSYLDASTGKVTVQDSVTLRNPNTERVAAVIAAHELDLWGTLPNTQLASIPLDDTHDANGALRARGWRTLLEGDRCADRAEELFTLAQNAGRPRSTFQWFDRASMRFRPNPYLRVSDVSLQLINDLSSLYGLHCQPTKKDALRSMVGTCRGYLVRGDVDFEPLAAEAAAHVNACTWNEQRTKFAEHKTYAHYDLAACFVYSLLQWRHYANVWPEPPEKLFNAGTSFAPDIDKEMEPWNYDDF